MIFIYFLLVCFIIIDLYLGLKFLEYFICANVRHQPPFVPSVSKLRRTLVKEIKMHYPNAKNIIEAGSGFGGAARYIARHCNCNVDAVENMPFTAFVSTVLDHLFFVLPVRTHWGDVFKYLEHTNKKYDIAVAYLGPDITKCLAKYKNKINVIISMDFEIPDLQPVRVIKLKSGWTKYRGIKYPHQIFVYEI